MSRQPPTGWSNPVSFPAGFTTRWEFSYAYLPPRNEAILFGGSPKDKSSHDYWNDTWSFDGIGWSRVTTATAPSPRGGAAMAYDPDIHKIVLFGGSGKRWPPFGDTWLFDGNDWTKVSTTGPSAREGAQMVYDPVGTRMVLFGGSGADGYNDVWYFDATTNSWTQGPNTPAKVAPRAFFGMAYDKDLQSIVVMGGDGKSDVWYFDPQDGSWTGGPDLPDPPGFKERVRMDYDPGLHGDVIFGGVGPAAAGAQTWMLRQGAWMQVRGLPSEITPPDRLDSAMLWNPDSSSLMVFGGSNGTAAGADVYADTWLFHYAPPQITAATLSPSNPAPGDTLTVTPEQKDGYGKIKFKYRWYVNGTRVATSGTNTYAPADHRGDTVSAEVEATDGVGFSSGWFQTNTVTVG